MQDRRTGGSSAAALLIAPVLLLLGNLADAAEGDFVLKLLGKHVFFDTNLSSSRTMGCVSCHDPANGGTGPDSDVNLHQVAITGANPATVGGRRPQTNTYASYSQPFELCLLGGAGPEQYCGGNFWDGRSQGRDPVTDGTLPVPPLAAPHTGSEIFYNISSPRVLRYQAYISPISDQALNPMPNPVEQNISRQEVCERVASSVYAVLYPLAWGRPIDCSTSTATAAEAQYDISFKRLMLAVGAYQHSRDINSFSSKRDIALRQELACVDRRAYRLYFSPRVCRQVQQAQAVNPAKEYGKFPLVGLTDEENLGHDLFYNVQFFPPTFGVAPAQKPDLPITQCAFCHSDHPNALPGNFVFDDGAELEQIYSDQAFHNIGTPLNTEIPNGPDTGLSRHATNEFDGFFRTPTIRNVDKRAYDGFVKGYGHNGYFKSLESIVHFYNTRSILPSCESVLGHENTPATPITDAIAMANNCWPSAEFPDTQAPGFAIFGPGSFPLVGNLGMTPAQEAALVAYMKTLSDRHSARPPLLLDLFNGNSFEDD
jgi:cytochrome c peroxidase